MLSAVMCIFKTTSIVTFFLNLTPWQRIGYIMTPPQKR